MGTLWPCTNQGVSLEGVGWGGDGRSRNIGGCEIRIETSIINITFTTNVMTFVKYVKLVCMEDVIL